LSRDDAKRLVEMKDWPSLFNKDQVVYLFPFIDLENLFMRLSILDSVVAVYNRIAATIVVASAASAFVYNKYILSNHVM
jgi:hypothetical protein